MAAVSEVASYLVQDGGIASSGTVYAVPCDGWSGPRGRMAETDSDGDDDDDDYDCAPAA
uniref:Uncharacterized protein n=1 Tax=Arundo donax TaxID=35708 RepID=A0A0A9A7F6_ARUDO